MHDRNFHELLASQWEHRRFVCVGLDCDDERIPVSAWKTDVTDTMLSFASHIVEATHDVVGAYKINIAFFEACGHYGWLALHRLIDVIRSTAKNVPIIIDAKRSDVLSTNIAYARELFEYLHADAVTVSPYFGAGALEPFLKQRNKGIFMVCRTSNPGADELQDVDTRTEGGVRPYYQHVAFCVSRWNTRRNCGVVVGATCPAELKQVRQIVGDMPILIPGFGLQGGSVDEVVSSGLDAHGTGIIISASRSIIFASPRNDYAVAARQETLKLHNAVLSARQAALSSLAPTGVE